jgi:hypothetical protein
MNNLGSCEITMAICSSFPKFLQVAELCYISGKRDPTRPTFLVSFTYLSFQLTVSDAVLFTKCERNSVLASLNLVLP